MIHCLASHRAGRGAALLLSSSGPFGPVHKSGPAYLMSGDCHCSLRNLGHGFISELRYAALPGCTWFSTLNCLCFNGDSCVMRFMFTCDDLLQDGSVAADLRDRLHVLMEKYGLWTPLGDEERFSGKSHKKKEAKPKTAEKPKRFTFKDKKLNKLWEKAQRAGFSGKKQGGYLSSLSK